MELEITGLAWKGRITVGGSDASVAALKAAVAAASGVASGAIRLIARGKRLEQEDASLASLGVTPGQKIMLQVNAAAPAPAVVSGPAPLPPAAHAARSFATAEAQAAWREAEIARMEAAASALAKRDASRRHGQAMVPELSDQSGRPVTLRPADAEAIKEGMMLHMRARYLLNKWQTRRARKAASQQAAAVSDGRDEPAMPSAPPSLAHTASAPSEDERNATLSLVLLLLLRADAAFARADASLLEVLDNPPQLYLDIVWTYFLMNDVQHIDDAAGYLRRCRSGFERCHGPDLSRLIRLKGEGAAERALYVRLRLLEGVVAYLQGNAAMAERHLRQARIECDVLMPNEQEIQRTLEGAVSLGLDATRSAALRALRATRPKPTVESYGGARVITEEALQVAASRAVGWLIDDTERRAAAATRERARRARERRQRKLGTTVSGAPVDVEMLDSIVGMLGQEEALVATALRQADNDASRAVSMLTDPEQLNALLAAMLPAVDNAEVQNGRGDAAAAVPDESAAAPATNAGDAPEPFPQVDEDSESDDESEADDEDMLELAWAVDAVGGERDEDERGAVDLQEESMAIDAYLGRL